MWRGLARLRFARPGRVAVEWLPQTLPGPSEAAPLPRPPAAPAAPLSAPPPPSALGRSMATSARCSEGPLGPDEAEKFRRELNEAGAAGDLGRLFSLVEARGERMDEAAVEAALAQTAHAAAVLGLGPDELRGRVHGHATFQTLIDMAARGAQRFSPESTARVVALLAGSLRCRDGVALDELGRGVVAGVARLGPTHLSLLVGGLAAADHSPGVVLLDAVRDRLAQLPPGEVPREQRERIDAALKRLGHGGLDAPHPPAPGKQAQPDRAHKGADYA
ncbi:hypothetical protein Rsub_08847 [Raphidocelis subcapitata]|uniref:Uncharacterized protein n=1 Tax=Raphidocelis subcapitata TaxID=307507 RepID=A0A2V0PAR1_9CHLO|nr:hypothetical protein Rsub_08847 [Raphidocelis subcapitata]|eukprot:GBF96032.1 hypothetical protein Rsub_08847 [Raphidocelis subcapitata]